MRGQAMTEAEVIALAQNMTDDERLQLIAKIEAIGTEQSHRIATYLLGLHMVERRPTFH
jgi:hypothetical protein